MQTNGHVQYVIAQLIGTQADWVIFLQSFSFVSAISVAQGELMTVYAFHLDLCIDFICNCATFKLSIARHLEVNLVWIILKTFKDYFPCRKQFC